MNTRDTIEWKKAQALESLAREKRLEREKQEHKEWLEGEVSGEDLSATKEHYGSTKAITYIDWLLGGLIFIGALLWGLFGKKTLGIIMVIVGIILLIIYSINERNKIKANVHHIKSNMGKQRKDVYR